MPKFLKGFLEQGCDRFPDRQKPDVYFLRGPPREDESCTLLEACQLARSAAHAATVNAGGAASTLQVLCRGSYPLELSCSFLAAPARG